MSNKLFGLAGILLILGIVMVSGCTSNGSKETVIFDSDVGGEGTTLQYVNVTGSSKINVEVSNTSVVPSKYFNTSYPELNVYVLTVQGQQGQEMNNYVDNIVDEKTFKISDGFNGNTTITDKGVKSLGIVTTDAKARVKVVAIN